MIHNSIYKFNFKSPLFFHQMTLAISKHNYKTLQKYSFLLAHLKMKPNQFNIGKSMVLTDTVNP